VNGISSACRENGCALLGGETAEMPGFYQDGEYDLAGFIVGAVERERLITGAQIRQGDVVIGLPSTGLHTNGYSLARRILFERLGLNIDSHVPELGEPLGDLLLRPHRSYLSLLRAPLANGLVKGLAHITGGGITDNLPRVLPDGTAAHIVLGSWTIPPLFAFLRRSGEVSAEEMLRTFNMGIGMIVIASPDEEPLLLEQFRSAGEPRARRIGEIVHGRRQVEFEGDLRDRAQS
jgi:phosphoribosylformylglycinamidine cyclo-ligase